MVYPISGIDVSHHQGPIEWAKLGKSEVRFAYIKATEGGDFVDPRFITNWDGAKIADVPRGGYHFFRLCKTGEEQAANFIKTVPVDASALPAMLDLEHMGPCTKTPAYKNVVFQVTDFLDRLEKHYGLRPVLYISEEFNRVHLSGKLEGEKFWARSLFLPPTFRKDSWIFWQYHNSGERDGVTGPVDLNVFRGSELEFRNFRNGL